MGKIYRVEPGRPIINALFYGDAGSGKTTLAASAQDCPDMADVMFLNVEGGLLSVAHRGDIFAVDVGSTPEMWKYFWRLAKDDPEFAKVRTVVIDSFTELQTMNLEEIVREQVKSSRRSRSGKVRTMDDIWQEDYGKSTASLKRLVRGFKNLKRNVIVTCLAKYVYPKVSATADKTQVEPVAVIPSLTAKLGESLMGYMDFGWYTFFNAEKEVFQLLTRPRGAYWAKTRGPKFQEAVGHVITNPNMSEIYELYVKATAGEISPRRPTKKLRKVAK